MKKYLKLMRVHHYIKNLLVFAALLSSGQFLNFEKFSAGLAGFIAFCMASSVVYIVNDIRDEKSDRCHPTKRKRPIAAGTISVRNAWILVVVLLAIASISNYIAFNTTATLLLVLYLILNFAYSFGLKHIPIVDVTILVAGFLIRVMYGALITGITISNWLYLMVIALAFYFSLGKRRNELRQLGDCETRQVLKSYQENFLDKNMSMSLTLANVFYALWSMDDKTISFYNNQYLVFTVPIVLLITMKYSFDIEGDSDGDPVEVLLNDKTLLTLCVLYLAVMFTILYL